MTCTDGSEPSEARHAARASLSIRPARPRDVEALARLFRRYREDVRHVTGEDATPSIAECHRQMAAAVQRRDGTVLVAEVRTRDACQIVGFCLLRIVVRDPGATSGPLTRLLQWLRRLAPHWLDARSGQRIAFMDDLYVAPEARRRGVALPLMRAAFAWGRAQGVTIMEGATWADNQAMLRLARHFDIEIVRVLLRKQL